MRRLVFAAMFIACGTVLPLLFHAVGMGSSVFLPMHIPVLLAGAVLGPGLGLVVGLLTPMISFLVTGMPPVSPPILPMMICELAVYGAVTGLARHQRFGLWLALPAALAAGRVALGLAAAVAYTKFGFAAAPVAYVLGGVVTGFPGILIQLLAVPALTRLMARAPLQGMQQAQ